MKKTVLVIGLLAALKLVLPFLLQHPAYELHRDEYLYYEQGQHLALGYLENPPLIGLLAYLSSLFGGTPFWIKFWPALFGGFTLVVTAGIARELGGKRWAPVIAASAILLTAFLRIHILFQPNFLDIFFWTLSAYYLVRYINTQQPLYLYLLSTALALGWWSKYSVLFFITAIVVSLLATPHRKLVQQKHFWGAVGWGMLLIAPNVWWQYQHNWPLAHHMDELRETQLRHLHADDFIKEQLLYLLPFLPVWLGGLVWLFRHHAFRIIAYMYLCVIVLLMIGSGKGYYALGTYPMLLAAGGVWLESVRLRRWRYAVVAWILVLSLPFIPLLLPMQAPQPMAAFNQKYGIEKLGLLKWEDQQNHPLQQDFADMQGWKELTQKSEAFFNNLPNAERVQTIVFCRHYGQAASLKYHAQSAFFRSKVMTDNGTFLLWIPDHLIFKNLLFIGRRMPDKDDAVFQHFQNVTVIDSVTNPLSRQYGDKIIYFQQADAEAIRLANEGLQQMKQQFRR